MVVVISWVGSCGFYGCPSTAQIQAFRPSEGSRVLDRTGKPIGRLTYVRRINVPVTTVPRSLRAAFIATEDRRFYYHGGVDWRSAGRALLRNLSAVGVREGFSTITMQVVRNAFLPHLSNERSFRRKLIELELARRLERTLTKQQILETYLNIIYLGNGTYGVEAASRDLFGKSVARLSLSEAATLAGLAKGPSLYAPRRHPDRARARRDLVLSLMVHEGYITPELAARARQEPLRLARAEWRPARDRSYALDPVRAAVDSVLGADAATAGDLVVHSTLDADAQHAAEGAIRIQGAAIQKQAARPRAGAEMEGAVVALDPRTGEIRALVGGRRSVTPWIQPRTGRAAPAGVGLQAVRVRRGAHGRLQSGHHPRRFAGGDQGCGTSLATGEFRRGVRRPTHPAAGADALGQCRDGAAEPGRGREAGGRAGSPVRHPEPDGRGSRPGARRPGGDAAGAGGGLRAVCQRRHQGAALHRQPDRGGGRHAAVAVTAPDPGAGARRSRGVSDHLDAAVGGGWRYRPGAAPDGRARTGGREDRYHQQWHRRLVHRLHPDAGCRVLVRL